MFDLVNKPGPNLDYISDLCHLPVIASDTNTFPSGNWPARAALVDGITEGMLPDGSKNIWAGDLNKEAGFVTDLGCEKTIFKIELRNTNTEYNYG